MSGNYMSVSIDTYTGITTFYSCMILLQFCRKLIFVVFFYNLTIIITDIT